MKKIIANDDNLFKIVNNEILKYGYNCSLNHIDVSKVRNMCCMFSDSIFNKNISNWQISNNTDTTFMLDNSIISKKNLPKILKALY